MCNQMLFDSGKKPIDFSDFYVYIFRIIDSEETLKFTSDFFLLPQCKWNVEMLQSPLCMPHEWSFLEEHRLTTNRGNGVSDKHQYLLVQTLTFLLHLLYLCTRRHTLRQSTRRKNRGRLIDWLTSWLTDWHPDWLTDWLKTADCLTDCLTELTEWPSDWLTDWLTDWMNDWLNSWLTDWLTDWLTNRLTAWLTD